jgi:hypothetical protein
MMASEISPRTLILRDPCTSRTRSPSGGVFRAVQTAPSVYGNSQPCLQRSVMEVVECTA